MKYFARLGLLGAAAITLALSGCGGGSGGPGGPNSYFATFKAPGTTTARGIGRDTTGQVGSVNLGPTTAVSADVGLDPNRKVNRIVLNTASGSRSWDSGNSRFASRDGLIVAQRTADRNAVAIVADPNANGFAHQTYGLWATPQTANTADGLGVFSVGTQTAGASVPTSGNATFRGKAHGMWIDTLGAANIVKSDATLNADFANRSIDFATTNSQTLGGGSASFVNMNGTLTYGPGSNEISGNVATAGGGGMTGTLDGRFYGPGAQEAGGVFSLEGSRGQFYTGAFGTTR